MRRGWIVLATSLALWATGAGGALACRFAPPKNPAEHLARADVAFVGRVIGTRPLPGREGWIETRFNVVRTLKGRPAKVRVVQQYTPTTCDYVRYRPGQTTLVLAMVNEGRLGTSTMLAPHFPLIEYEKAARRSR
ncbi:hypothetical protein GVN21_13855 [Caulobacter sp. SLTY]|uniref:hypothetical protein n=1 Tax=Caulobacter sp. SLTY TaxID=2683262 RepID=UPI001412A0AB|nr:hypothetical protein [Caulobacter sp. SLTY]NBB16446.1 hypothetical protein [Caulobacter sp. SLTY]